MESELVEGSVTVTEFEADYDGTEAPEIRRLFGSCPSVTAVLVQDNAGMIYEVTRDRDPAWR